MIGGVESGPEDDGIVALRSSGPHRISRCTATLIAPNLLITARHCVSVYDDGGGNSFTCTEDGDLLNSDGTAGVMSILHDPEAVEVYVGQVPSEVPDAHGVEIIALNTTSICRNDIAFVVLDKELDVPLLPLRLDQGVVPREPMRVVGYGINDQSLVRRFTRSELPVLAVGRSEFWPDGGLAPPRSFALGTSVCEGDSGGPALDESGAVAGVYSFFTGACTTESVRNYYTDVASFAELADNALTTVGYSSSGGAGGAGNTQGGTSGAGGATSRANSENDSKGCSCGIASRASHSVWWALLMSALGAVRRRAVSRSSSRGEPPTPDSSRPVSRTGSKGLL